MTDMATLVDGRYRILSRIGSGGMADVYLAEDTQLGRHVALKVLYRRFAEDGEFVERFRREASSAAGLLHPNVVSVFDRGEWDGTYYIAMEYLHGHSLKAIVREHGALDPATAIDIVTQILRAARFAHQRGIIHRDLKPHNVIVDEEGRVRVTDFGIARAGASDMTQTGSIMGTAQYLSPEQAQGHAVSAASDIYAVGIVLYELLTGTLPFDGETAVTIALKQVSEAPMQPSSLNPAVTPALDAVVARALAKDPAHRYPDADQFIAALAAARAGLYADVGMTARYAPVTSTALVGTGVAQYPTGTYAPVPYATGEQSVIVPPPSANNNWVWWVLGALVVAAIVSGGLYLALRQRHSTVPTLVPCETSTIASAAIVQARLKPQPLPVTSTVCPAGGVISSDPVGGSVVDRDSTVTLTVSTGPGTKTVPYVVGLTRDDATSQLQASDFKTSVSYAYSTTPVGHVISTDPNAGVTQPYGSTVKMLVSKGVQLVSVPTLTTQATASAALAAAGLKLGAVTEQPTADEAPGTVISQSQAPGKTVPKGSSVDIFVAQALPKMPVPNVLGQDEGTAAAMIGSAGFGVVTTEQVVPIPAEVNTVVAQMPHPQQLAKHGATVTLVIGTAPVSTTTSTKTTNTTVTIPATSIVTTTPPASTTTTTTPITTTSTTDTTTTTTPPASTTTTTATAVPPPAPPPPTGTT